MKPLKPGAVLQSMILIVLLTALPQVSCTTNPNQQNLIEQLPDGQDWLNYFKQDLMPFYFNKQAFGEPIGNFPTWRCNNGEVFNPDKPCSELSKSYKPRESVISKSRQTYFYGVAYHLTGDEQALTLAKAGVDYIRNFAIDAETGSIATFIKDGKAMPSLQHRTALQLAYGVLGMAFYYYLTRDESVLSDIVRLKNYLFDHYYDENLNLIMWLPVGTQVDQKNPDTAHLKQWQRLSAQLDQINTYLLLLTPVLPGTLKSEWKQDLIKLADIMIDNFYDNQQSRFKFALDTLTEKEQSNHKLQPNFGRSIKAFWMIYFIAKMSDNSKLLDWVESNAAKLLQQAYIEQTGSWGYRLLENGSVDENKLSWIYIELEMMAATLVLKDASYGRYMERTNQYWFDHFVDKQDHEIWTWLTPAGEVNKDFPKMLFYKKGFHSAEHALVSYITTQAMSGKPVELYYAFDKSSKNTAVFPYYYSAGAHKTQIQDLADFKDLKKVKVTFSQIH